ncbi:energy-coupling factor ABC transporter ATP-binding protein [Microbacterium suwonense]|uniref:Cobalt ABC transporter ATP-binding protein n=1 Tax=Microbacterium suwonense TaxID=683047 RepID=A0ABN6X1R4_9MICO|nr:ABC transporter ATP-binding protein [Microbacterium suwonense]BDZ38100.1 cobalt ABC transporter ATP-binding protein [Microbacterium suwonense]
MRPEPAASGSTISCEGVGLDIDGIALVHDVNLRLGAGRIAIIGANGSGKSTFARMLNGLRTPTAGSLIVHGLDPVRDAAALRRHVGFVFTNPEAQILMPTPAEDLALSLTDVPRNERATRITEILERYGLADRADVPVSGLSGGQRQLLAIASVLATEPGLVVADEPTTLLDLRNARRIGDLLLGLDVPLVLVTHDLELAARCDEAVLFEGGTVRAVGEPAVVIDEYRRSCI